MLFNSFGFIFLFLPITVAGYFLAAARLGAAAAKLWLIAASVFFYGWWNPAYVPLLAVLMLFTFIVGRRLSERPSRPLLAFGIGMLLLALGYFKYAGFLVANLDALTGSGWTLGVIVLPLAISFFTFQKIAYLVDSHRGLTRDTRFLDYALFVVFFPQLIAGPIVHWKEVLPQFRLPANLRPHAVNFAVGIAIFAAGLFKKAVLADGIAAYASPTFAAAAAGAHPDLLTAWSAALAYTFQLYFDFSGYSDMAIGAARLFGVVLPLNFNSPYKAGDISDFWRRWHMTLSRFLRDYLYIALGGNRRGETRRYANLMATMLLGGLWHGAGWTFVLWGGLHGLYLVINHGWQGIAPTTRSQFAAYRMAAWLLTFVAVVIAWVPFRSVSMAAAGRMLAGMAGVNGVSLPSALGARLGTLRGVVEGWGVDFALGGGGAFAAGWLWIAGLGLIALGMPNTQEMTGGYEPGLGFDPARAARLRWAPTRGWAVTVAAVAVTGTLALSRVSEFSISSSDPMQRYLGTLAIAFALLLATVAGFAWLVDPYGYWPVPRVNNVNVHKPFAGKHLYAVKLRQAERVQPRLIIAGNSRVAIGFDPKSVTWPRELRPVYNMGLAGFKAPGTMETLLRAVRSHQPSAVILGVDIIDFTVTEADWRAWRPHPPVPEHQIWRDEIEMLVSLDALTDSARSLVEQHRRHPQSITPEGYDSLGQFTSIVEEVGHAGLFAQRNRENAARFRARSKAVRWPEPGGSDAWAALDELAAECKRRSIPLTVITYPYHVDLLLAFERTGLLPGFEDWQRALADFSARTGVPVIDFSRVTPETSEAVPPPGDTATEMRWYWEGGHFKAALGDRLVADIFGHAPMRLGVRLTPQSAGPLIAETRAALAAYRSANPAQAARLDREIAAPAGLPRQGGLR